MTFEFKGSGFDLKGESFSFAKGFAKADPDNPLKDVEYCDPPNLNEDCARELEALQKDFSDRARRERDRYRDATDSEYWFAVCFKTRKHKERFLKELGVKRRVLGDKYIDGHMLAKLMGFDIE